MKTLPTLFALVGIFAAVTFLTGCESNKQFKENALLRAGFKTVPATTPAQQAHLMALSQTKISPVQRNGVRYYVFPDVANNVLYVGRQAEYNVYRANKRAQERELDYQMETQSSFISNDAYLTSFASWGAWEGLPW